MEHERPLIFSAHNLQTFVDCERRFELQYLDRMTWPAIPAHPPLAYEQLMADGRRFHRMVEQDLLGAAVLEPTAADTPEVADWWENYGMYDPAGEVEGERFIERMLVGTIGSGGPTLVAQYDLIVWNGEAAVIFDWKTSRQPPQRARLLERMQTRVYRYLLASSGAALTGGTPIPPEAVQMVYWFARYPEEPVVVGYDSDTFRQDERYLTELVDRIAAGRQEGRFPLTEDERLCQYCTYRSFCGRGAAAGPLLGDEADDAVDLALDALGDLDEIEAIAFK
ncbi:MAG: PD-(D/E)XK nuclease family protein [Rhodothermales bacterium]